MKRTLGRLAGCVVALGTVVAQGQFRQVNLVSDGTIPAAHRDPNLINAWGLAAGPTTPFWVADEGMGVATVYDGSGNSVYPGNPLVVTIPGLLVTPTQRDPSHPTGVTYNTSGQNFVLTMNGQYASAKFLFATAEGTIAGWNPTLGDRRAIIAVNHSASGNSSMGPSAFTGLAMASWNGFDFLYAANFANGTIDVFNDRFRMVGQFSDGFMENGYAPFGIANVGGNLIVTYAKRGANGEEVAGNGFGFVDVFSGNGHLVKRLVSHVGLNAPWGIALAPGTSGKFAGTLLIGNFGDGKIHGYDMSTGANMGAICDKNGIPLQIEGLWALQYGNGTNGGDPNELFFTAGPSDEAHGLFGKIVNANP